MVSLRMEHQAKLDLDHRLVAQVGDAQHQRRLSVEGRDHHRAAEGDARRGPGETHEDQPGDHG